ncbi:hypothetical protein HG536_0B01280 [Torulaspora globosa]|uniref:DNA repair protein RAD50 n=1 Tax=Torulaspora globosa TaxID=48254 RepID=A0A7G3ZCN1_9SACH|nr:uncharacterized protein HG536_0B01280 [Torulaspora globosa]QLL31267.1 hypothetical protein HG536_0B01280 [Torulaspora globosa]
MSAIYKLSIQGIRSFDSNDRETIEFGKPLTLIVGANGSGKTTIIECLKYATSGDLPPNSKGGAFVHDPKITGEKDIRAQVKLAFTSANNLNMIVTRNIQLLVKKTTTTFKTLEGQLVIVNGNGNRNTLSTRSVELDTQVPLYLGVPKAILDYVIFCHQEDSLWPLSEPANLKKKFDEIFQAMKFTKALDNLKGIKKDMSIDIRLLKQSVEHLRVDRDRSKMTEVNINQLEAKVDAYKAEVKEIENQLVDITEQSDHLFKSNQDFQKILSRVENLKNNRESLSQQIKRLSNAVDIIDLPRKEVEQLLKSFASTLKVKEMEMKHLEEETKQMKERVSKLQAECNGLMIRQGELTAACDLNEKRKDRLRQKGQEVIALYKLTVNDQCSSDVILSKLKSVRDKLRLQSEEIEEVANREIEALERELNGIRRSAIVRNERLEYGKQDRDKISREIDRLQKELAALDISGEDLETERASLNRFTEKLKEWEKVDVVGALNKQIKEKNDQMVILENELDTLQTRISRTNDQADLYARLSIVKQSLQDKFEEMNKKIQTLEDDPMTHRWQLKYGPDLDIEFKRKYIDVQKETSGKRQLLQDLDKKYTEAALNLNNTESELAKNRKLKENLLAKLQKALPEDCPIEDYDEVVAESESSYRIALENLKMHQTTIEFNKRALEVAEKERSCYLCSRKFENEKFASGLLEKLRTRTDSRFEDTLKETVSNEKEYLDTLRGLKEDILSLQSAKSRIADLSEAKSNLREEVKRLKIDRDQCEVELKKVEEDRSHAEQILRPIVDYIIRSVKEVKQLEDQNKTITDELALYGTSEDGVRTVEELQTLQRSKNDLLRSCRKEINYLQEEKQNKLGEYTRLSSVIKERGSKVTELEKQLMLKENITADINSKSEQLNDLESTIESLGKEVDAQNEKMKHSETQLTKRKKTFAEEHAASQNSCKAIDGHINELSKLKTDVDSFALDGPQELESCTKQLEERQREVRSLSEAIERESEGLMKQAQRVKDSNNEKRNLEQNLELINLKESLSSIEKEINDLDVQNAEAERDKYQQESLRLRNLYEKLSSENAGKLGEIKQLQNQIEAFARQLQTDYKDVENDYHKKWVELQTRTFVADDIDTYSKALDSAIMRYHGLKMQDINRIIDELWKRTYSGTDVDSIRIRSDEVGSSVKGKSYNYRVVMYKQDAELDMRGRCSAGQKVLASIIIRLALSETFGVNCGVIALDEPTTNLDEENIESLAKSLSNIIEMRRHQKNFQLIVITHDEQFLNHMNASEFTDHFFRVKRDDRQKSQIEWVDISRVSD